jgi:ABC-type antimicrobial peptide transport system permease subunit
MLAENKAVPSTMFDTLANIYPDVNVLGLYEGDWFKSDSRNMSLFEYSTYSAIIEDTSDIEKTTGMKLEDGYLPVGEDSLYLTDAILNNLANATISIDNPQFNIDDLITGDGGYTISPDEPIAAYYLKRGDETIVLVANDNFSSFVGLELWERQRKNSSGTVGDDVKLGIISGIIRTDYKELSIRYENASTYDKQIIEYKDMFEYMLVFSSKEAQQRRLKPTNKFSIDYSSGITGNSWREACYDIQISTSTAQTKQNGITIKLADGNEYNWGSVSSKLGDNEVILSLDMYNRIFNDNLEDPKYSKITQPDNIGEKISLRIRDKSGRLVGSFSDYTLVEVVPNADGDTMYVGQDTFDRLSPISITADMLLFSAKNNVNLETFLKEFRAREYYVYDPFSIWLYLFESDFQSYSPIFYAASCVFLLFSALLIMNFISAGVKAKKKDIGILRALGARVLDTEKIFIFESIIIATIICVISILGLLLTTFFINMNFAVDELENTSIMSFNMLSVLIIAGVSYIITGLSSFIPVYNISKTSPVDAIKKVA